MRKRMILGILLGLFLTTAIVSCKDDKNEPTYKKETISDATLLKVLKTKGFNFEGDLLIIDDKVNDAKTLDLSGSSLSKLMGLELFPNLEEVNLSNNNIESSDALANLPAKVTSVNLAKNKFVTVFDFAKLPESVKSIDLSDNEIYEYRGLATVDFANAKVSVLRTMEKIVLPYTARFNVETLPFYLNNSKETKMQMQNKQGTVEDYTTLREIPDELLRTYLKRVFSSKFEGDKIDLYKNFSLEEKNTKMNVSTSKPAGGFWVEKELIGKKFTSMEGVEYIINDSRYEGQMWAWLDIDQSYTLGYLKPGENFTGFGVTIGINTPLLDLSNAKSITHFTMEHNKDIKKVDLSVSTKFLQRGEKGHGGWFQGDMLSLVDCPELEEIIFPDVSKTPDPVAVAVMYFGRLPKLKTNIDLSKMSVIMVLGLWEIPETVSISYPEKFSYFLDNGEKSDHGRLDFYIDEAVYNRKATKDFIAKYPKEIEQNENNKVDNYNKYFTDSNEVSYGVERYNFYKAPTNNTTQGATRHSFSWKEMLQNAPKHLTK